MPSFKKFYKENRKKAIQSQKNSVKLLQLLMILCSYNFIKFSMCSYNFNVAVRISINHNYKKPKRKIYNEGAFVLPQFHVKSFTQIFQPSFFLLVVFFHTVLHSVRTCMPFFLLLYFE